MVCVNDSYISSNLFHQYCRYWVVNLNKLLYQAVNDLKKRLSSYEYTSNCVHLNLITLTFWRPSASREKNVFFTHSSLFWLVFGQLAWEWLKMSFAPIRAHFPTNRHADKPTFGLVSSFRIYFDLSFSFSSLYLPFFFIASFFCPLNYRAFVCMKLWLNTLI